MRRWLIASCVAAVVLACASRCLWAAELKITFPLGRTAYQTNEWIDVSAVRTNAQALAKGDLVLKLTGDDGSAQAFTFPVAAVAVAGNNASTTEHLHLNGRLLRPGHYAIEVSCDGATQKAEMDVFSHVRKSTFRIVDWASSANGPQLEVVGEESVGQNLILGSFGNENRLKNEDFAVRGGVDFMQIDTLGGAHQIDMRLECDWSDPYVLGGGVARASRQAFANRTAPNAAGVHLYDEPGLTWIGGTPHNIPAQMRAYRAAFDRDLPSYKEFQADDPQQWAQWMHWGRWKQSFMQAAWKLCTFGITYANPDFMSAVQSVYGWNSYTDGYYFTIAKDMPVISGHGGYDNLQGGYYMTSYWLDYGRARTYTRPMWYMPTWYDQMVPECFRLEQYLSFMNNLQGMTKPPGMTIQTPEKQYDLSENIVESNKLMLRLGTIFNHMQATTPDVAVLYALSQSLNAQTKDMKDNYDGNFHITKQLYVFIASKLIHIPTRPVLEEDVLDGTVPATYTAIVLAGVDYLPPDVIAALEKFAVSGKSVLLTDDCTVQIKGATKIGVPIDLSLAKKMQELGRNYPQTKDEMAKLNVTGNYIKLAEPLAAKLQAALEKAGVKPPFGCDQPGICVNRQAFGDIEYFFAANATFDPDGGAQNSLKPVDATLSFPAAGGPIYDAVMGGPASQFKQKGKELTATLRFGSGAMKVFARTTRPIGGVSVGTPVVIRDFTNEKEPLHVEIAATLVDDKGKVLCGSAPMAVQVIDPLGAVRYDLWRATERGVLALSLPLAANDPAGQWKVVVQDQLSGKADTATFGYQAANQCGTAAGATVRAVYFGNDRENIFRFFRLHRNVTIVAGSGDFNQAAAERIQGIIKPWDVTCTVMTAAEAAKVREIPPEAQGTWAGLQGKPNPQNPSPIATGFAVRGPVILLGNPDDNAIIKFLQDTYFLPYRPLKDELPGRGRGYMSWQSDGVGYFNQESVTMIAYDAASMSEAVGSMYEAATGLDPLSRWAMPTATDIASAKATPGVVPQPKVAWEAIAPDRVIGMRAEGGKLTVVSFDGTVTTVGANGKMTGTKVETMAAARDLAKAMTTPVDAELAKKVKAPNLVPKKSVAIGGDTAIAYWGGTVKIVDAQGQVKLQQKFSTDIGALAVLDGKLVVGAADGRVVALQTNGTR